jgi:hypothetical protein
MGIFDSWSYLFSNRYLSWLLSLVPMMITVIQGSFTFENYARVVALVAKYHPFYDLEFGAVAQRLQSELENKTCLLIFNGTELVLYCGWVITSQDRADRWINKKAPLPLHRDDGDSAVITHVVTDDHEADLFKKYIGKFKELLDGKKIYRLKVFNDGRDEIRRAPITVRKSNEK